MPVYFVDNYFWFLFNWPTFQHLKLIRIPVLVTGYSHEWSSYEWSDHGYSYKHKHL